MRSLHHCSGFVGAVALTLLASYHGAANADFGRAIPVVLGENEQIVRDQLIILVDESATIGTGRIFRHEKALVEYFTASMPDGAYQSGLKSFAGVPSHQWVEVSLRPFNRAAMMEGSDSLEPLGATTPLARSISWQKSELEGRGGRGALLIFSDGRVTSHEEVLQACRDLKAFHGGELCIFTVQVGNSRKGTQLLREMASVNGCGTYYDGNMIETEADMHALVRNVLVGPRETMRQAAAPRPAPDPPQLSLENVHFDNDIHVVHPMYSRQLDEVAALLAGRPEVRLQLHGHTDSNASHAYNQALSERRVNAVRAALAQRGVNTSRIETRAHGEELPAVPNTTPQNMHANRRVELVPIQ